MNKLSTKNQQLSTRFSTTNPQKRECWVLVVHYGDQKRTNHALAALLAAAPPPEHIWVIDHSPEPYVLPANHPPGNTAVRVIRPPRNTGYGGGLNFGLGALTGSGAKSDDLVICMNNDVIVETQAIAVLRRLAAQQTAPALIGTATLRAGTIQAGMGSLNMWTGRAALTLQPAGAHQTNRRQTHAAGRSVPYLNGALIAAPYRVWLRLRGWPEQYFLYWEDVAISFTARRRGITLLASDTVLARHAAAVSSRGDNELYYLVRNGAAFLQQELPLPWRWYWRVRNQLRRLYHALHPGSSRTVRQALRDTGVTGPRPIY
ncbi:MAG: hypothetical protein COT71_00830 [Candidatus Andersenbacteria bacterium CG10_big_fil_rev_8_21_14_0_10_54_11]|uniref:Glycosyltransferase 2-like domain-containing protein n=1 Tax=Candidatus Andersenbacteria bacterium CG10_big_fil_rev_8_21_14_0_10_54_11 TaxID=1974485 RepID=A0A2M6X031_9BACT|nr:MAG: hypothetical protein COT71_00830 [Candidatus Andersenbacteria bacterium CG10_big_fil_rev_8_21_14_0_10_54_11]